MKALTMKTTYQTTLALMLGFGMMATAHAQVLANAAAASTDVHPYLTQTLLYPTEGGTQALTSVLRSFSVTGLDGKMKTLTSTVLIEQNGPLPTVVAQGGNYSLLAGNILQTVSADGLVSTVNVAYGIDQKGGMYFTQSGSHELVVVDSYGMFYSTGMIVTPTLLGGNFYISPDATTGVPKITTFRSSGSFYTGTDGKRYHGWAGMPTTYADSMTQVDRVGGNYFVNKDGTLGTVDSMNGYFFNNLVNDAAPAADGMGGNFFIGTDKILYTVDYLGIIRKFKTIRTDQIKKLGASYIEFNDETMLFIDYKGTPQSTAIEFVANGPLVELSHLPKAGVVRDGAKPLNPISNKR